MLKPDKILFEKKKAQLPNFITCINDFTLIKSRISTGTKSHSAEIRLNLKKKYKNTCIYFYDWLKGRILIYRT